MTGAAALLDAVRAAGATIRPRLWVEPLDRLDPELRAALRSREAEVIAFATADRLPEADSHTEAERAAIAAEPPLPAPGIAERARLDALHREMVAGYRAAALRRPPSWSDPKALPSAGCRCSCCGGAAWWCETEAPTGWRCAICHPAPRSWPAGRVREGRT